jgi:hypothetical protein
MYAWAIASSATVGQRDGAGVAEVVPITAAIQSIAIIPGPMTGRLYPQDQAGALFVPGVEISIWSRLGLADIELVQAPPIGPVSRCTVIPRPRHRTFRLTFV